MAFNISSFQSALAGGGARPSLFSFEVTGAPAGTSGGLKDVNFLCSVSALPGLTVTPIERQYFGRTVKIPGDMVFGDLSTTIINTENYSVRTAVENWSNKINNTAGNVGFSDSTSAFGSVTLTQYNKTGSSLLSWTFIDAWPQTISEVALSYDTASEIETFDITWAYNYYTQAKGSATTASSKAVHI